MSDHPNLNAALEDAARTFGDAGGQLHLDEATTLVAPARYHHHNLQIRGNGNASAVRPTFAAGDYLHFAREGGVHNLLLQDFLLEAPGDRGEGWALRLDHAARATIDNVDLSSPESTGRHAGGIWFNGYDDCRVDDTNIVARRTCIRVNGRADQSFGADLVLGGGNKLMNHRRPDMADHEPGSVGLHLAGGQGGTYVDATHVIYCGVGILIDTSGAGVLNREVFLNPGTVVDSCVEDGIRVLEGAVGTLQMTGVWSASNGRGGEGCGLRVQPDQHPIAMLQVTGGRWFNNATDGIAVSGGYAAISGPLCDFNGGHGLHVANTAVRGGADPLFAGANRAGAVRNVSTAFATGTRY